MFAVTVAGLDFYSFSDLISCKIRIIFFVSSSGSSGTVGKLSILLNSVFIFIPTECQKTKIPEIAVRIPKSYSFHCGSHFLTVEKMKTNLF